MKELGPNIFQRLEQSRKARDSMLANFLGSTLQPTLPEPIHKPYSPRSRRTANVIQSTFAALLAFGSAACGPGAVGGGSPDKVSKNLGAELMKNNPGAPFITPVEPSPNLHIQQGFFYDEGDDLDPTTAHGGLDIIKKDADGKWVLFNIRAVADGLACKNPESRQGLTAFIFHPNVKLPGGAEADVYSLSGHMSSIIDMPECKETADTASRKPVKQGQYLGQSGADGVYQTTKDGKKIPRPDWIHLHFQVNLERVLKGIVSYVRGGHLDPMGIYGKSAQYPKLDFSNGITCGEYALFKECPMPDNKALIANPQSTVPSLPTLPMINPTTEVPILRPTESPTATSSLVLTRQAVIATAPPNPTATESPRTYGEAGTATPAPSMPTRPAVATATSMPRSIETPTPTYVPQTEISVNVPMKLFRSTINPWQYDVPRDWNFEYITADNGQSVESFKDPKSTTNPVQNQVFLASMERKGNASLDEVEEQEVSNFKSKTSTTSRQQSIYSVKYVDKMNLAGKDTRIINGRLDVRTALQQITLDYTQTIFFHQNRAVGFVLISHPEDTQYLKPMIVRMVASFQGTR